MTSFVIPIEPSKTVEPTSLPTSPAVQAWHSDHVWPVALSAVAFCEGLWTQWPPNTLAQVHPYSWYVVIVIDHFSRRMMGFAVFEQEPAAPQAASAMERICTENNVKPKYLIPDQGVQFVADKFCRWCKANDVKQRFGAVGKHGSTAVKY